MKRTEGDFGNLSVGPSTVTEEMEQHTELMEDDVMRSFIIFALISANHKRNQSKLKKSLT